MKRKKRLIDTISKKMLKKGECIISSIAKTNSFEWLTDELAYDMDYEYYLNESGQKPISLIYNNLLKINDFNYIATTDDDEIYVATLEDDEELISTTSDDTKEECIIKLRDIIINKYADKWNRIYDAFVDSIYAPLENYSMVEEETTNREKTMDDDEVIDGEINHSGTITNSDTYGGIEQGTITIDDDTTITDTKGTTITRTFNNGEDVTELGKQETDVTGNPIDKVYPSFSSGATPIKESVLDTKQETSYTNRKTEKDYDGTISDANTGSDTNRTLGQVVNQNETRHTGGDTHTQTNANKDENDVTRNRDVNESEDITRSHTRSGNIGVTTSQQMLASEIELRENFTFLNMIYRDIDKILTSYVW